jgi:mannosidase alpha-like ER degradation enhancer 1
MLSLNSTHLRSPSPIGRILRRSSQPTCPVYVAPRVALDFDWRSPANESMRHIGGLIGTVRDRVDFEYARLLSGISVDSGDSLARFGFGTQGTKSPAVVSKKDMVWWDPNGWCEVPKVEEYVSLLLRATFPLLFTDCTVTRGIHCLIAILHFVDP